MGSTFVTAASDWIDESLRDVASMFPDDGDMFRTAASTDGSGGFVHSRLQLALLGWQFQHRLRKGS